MLRDDIDGASGQSCVVTPHRPHEYARRRPHQGRGWYVGVLQSLPSQLEHDALLRIHRHSLSRRNAEERSIEAVDTLEKSTMLRVHAPRNRRIRIEEVFKP